MATRDSGAGEDRPRSEQPEIRAIEAVRCLRGLGDLSRLGKQIEKAQCVIKIPMNSTDDSIRVEDYIFDIPRHSEEFAGYIIGIVKYLEDGPLIVEESPEFRPGYVGSEDDERETARCQALMEIRESRQR